MWSERIALINNGQDAALSLIWEPNVCLVRLRMKFCQVAKLFAARKTQKLLFFVFRRNFGFGIEDTVNHNLVCVNVVFSSVFTSDNQCRKFHIWGYQTPVNVHYHSFSESNIYLAQL